MATRQTADFDVLANSAEFAESCLIIQNLTGLAMALNTPDIKKIHIPLKLTKSSPLCDLIQATPIGNARCRACDRKFHRRAGILGKPISYTCHAGLIDMAIPIIVEGKHVATVSCGQILPEKPGNAGARRILKRISSIGVPAEKLKKAYFKAPYLSKQSINSVMRLQHLFAQHLCESASQLRKLSAKLEREDILSAKNYIKKNFRNGGLQLSDVARSANLSPAYFCCVFHKSTGIHYSHYLQEQRIAEAKRLLSDTQKSISEICHSCGFNSLTHFNRVFQRIEACSPSQYRKKTLCPQSKKNPEVRTQQSE